jgi:hypothetical protein
MSHYNHFKYTKKQITAIHRSSNSEWLFVQHKILVKKGAFQKWRTTDWSTSGALLTAQRVQEEIGDRLRLPEYRSQFINHESARKQSEALSESQPAHQVSALVLRQWYTKFHPDSGSLSYATIEALEQGMGDELRRLYPDMAEKMLMATLSKRLKAVVITRKVARLWLRKYGGQTSLSAASASTDTRVVRKRPASKAGIAMQPRAKRRATGPPIPLLTAKRIEEHCG